MSLSSSSFPPSGSNSSPLIWQVPGTPSTAPVLKQTETPNSRSLWQRISTLFRRAINFLWDFFRSFFSSRSVVQPLVAKENFLEARERLLSEIISSQLRTDAPSIAGSSETPMGLLPNALQGGKGVMILKYASKTVVHCEKLDNPASLEKFKNAAFHEVSALIHHPNHAPDQPDIDCVIASIHTLVFTKFSKKPYLGAYCHRQLASIYFDTSFSDGVEHKYTPGSSANTFESREASDTRIVFSAPAFSKEVDQFLYGDSPLSS